MAADPPERRQEHEERRHRGGAAACDGMGTRRSHCRARRKPREGIGEAGFAEADGNSREGHDEERLEEQDALRDPQQEEAHCARQYALK